MIVALLTTLAVRTLASAIPSATDWQGTVCVATKLASTATPTCEAVHGTAMLPAGSKHFEYYWISQSGDALRVGSVDNADKLTLASTAVGQITWRLSPVPASKSLSAATIELTRTSLDPWVIRLPLVRVAAVSMCYVPPGTYSMQIRAGGFKRISRRGITVADGKRLDLGTLRLDPLPEIRGAVLGGGDGLPVSGAAILVGSSRVATTDSRGHFVFTPDDEVPLAITVRSDGYAEATVAVGSGPHGFELEPILLNHGSTVTFRVTRSCADNCDTSLSIRRLDTADPRPQQWKSVAERHAYGQNPSFTFESLQSGEYRAVFAGSEPLQRKIVSFTVSGGASEQNVTLAGGRLKGVVSRAHTLLGNEPLSFSGANGLWTSTVTTDDDGQYDLATWRPELLFASIGGGTQPFRASRQFVDAEEDVWDISVPSNAIKGRVVDAATGEPVGNATVSDALVSGAARHGPFPLTAGPDGRFSLETLPAGMHRLQATASGYLDSAPVDVELTASDERRTIDIPLHAGISIKLTFVDDAGNPIPNVLVFDSFGADGFSTTRVLFTNALGQLDYHVDRAQRRGLYALTENGSFAVIVADAANPTPPPVTLPAPSATLDLLATRDQRPVRAISFLVRFNGSFLPPGFFDQVTSMLRGRSNTDASGHLFLARVPPGMYELWPFADYDAYRELLRNVNVSEPHARIVVAPGENSVRVPVEPSR